MHPKDMFVKTNLPDLKKSTMALESAALHLQSDILDCDKTHCLGMSQKYVAADVIFPQLKDLM